MNGRLRRARLATGSDRVTYFLIDTVLILFTVAVAYPVIFVISSSFSSPVAVSTGRVMLWPVELSLRGYKAVFSHRLIFQGFRNTFLYTIVATMIGVVVTFLSAYPLSRPDCPLRRAFMFVCVLTMFFSGGLIPTYILMTQIGFINNVWAMVVPGALSVWLMIVIRTFIMSNIPAELLSAAEIDGCSDARYFFAIVLPLSKAVLAVVTLFYAVANWNAYFNALIYLNDPAKYPLQIILRDILIANQIQMSDILNAEQIAQKQGMSDLLRFSLIIVSSAPIIAFYPFVQKYFIKGVMLGSLKG